MVDNCVIVRRFLEQSLLPILIAGLVSTANGQRYEGRELVQARLVADTDTIVAGKPFTVGLRLHMVPRWHTYWKYPGDAGIPTELKWHLPAGWQVDAIQWPIPLRLEEPGDIRIYGYHDEVLLMQRITPPALLSEKSFTLKADASWLVCEKICIPGNAALSLDLPVGTQSIPANEELFSRYRRSLPQPWPAGQAGYSTWQRTPSELRLTIASRVLANYGSVEFYPVPEGTIVVGHPKTELVDSEKLIIHVPLEGVDKGLTSLDGIVVFGREANGADRNAWSLNNPAAGISVPTALATGRFEIARFLLFGFLGGFILNLMPCVLPVISLKIFGFIRHAGESRRRIFRSGIAFVAGIFTWFVGLALFLVLLKTAGRELTWAVQFTNPYFVVLMSAVVLVFALNLFGVFEISLPESANTGLLNWSARKDDVGSFFQGVFATVLATPCTAPFLGTALGFAFAQSSGVILAMFVAIATGMSAPYLLLSAQPAWLRFLPRPGPWMIWVKQLMGFLLLATLLFLLFVLGAERGAEAIIWVSAFLLVLGFGCWMTGIFLTPVASTRSRVIASLVILGVLVTSGFYFLGNKFPDAKLPQASGQLKGDWQPFTPERLEAELANDRPVFIDFTAAWCLTCKFNETAVLESRAVREAFQRSGVVKLKADWTNADPVITKMLKQFGRPGVPLYVLYPGKSEKPVVFPELLTKSILLEKLDTIMPHVAAQ